MTHVLAVRLDNDGDVLLAGPAIRAVAARRRPGHAAVRPARAARPRSCCPASTRCSSGGRRGSIPSRHPVDRDDVAALVARIAALGVDRAVIFGSFHQSPLPMALVLRLAGVPWIGATSVDYPRLAARRAPPDRRRRARGRALPRPRPRRRASPPPGDDGRLNIRGTVASSALPDGVRGRPPGRVGAGAGLVARAQPASSSRALDRPGGGDRRAGRARAHRVRRRRARAPTSAAGPASPSWRACSPAPTRSSSATPARRTSPRRSDAGRLAVRADRPGGPLAAVAGPARAAVHRRPLRRLPRARVPGARPPVPGGRRRPRRSSAPSTDSHPRRSPA